MYRFIIAAAVLFGASDLVALGQGKQTDSIDARKAILDVISALEREAQSAPKVIGKQSTQELVLVGRFADTKYTFDDLLKYAKELTNSTADEKTQNVLRKYGITLETMARTKTERVNEKNEIKKLIWSLRNQRGFEFFTTDDPKSPAAKLLAVGKKAIPYLIDEVTNDELTRSVSPEVNINRRVISPMYVLRIGDCVCGILKTITGQSFGESWYIHDPQTKMSPKQVQEVAKKWWEKQK